MYNLLNDTTFRELLQDHKQRGPNEMTKENHFIKGNEYWFKDRFNGMFFHAGDKKEIKKDYIKCVNCGRINIKIRESCWNCGDSISIINPKFEIYDKVIK